MHAHAHALGYTHARTYTQACTHTDEYVIVVAFPQQQWFGERASLLRYTYIACLFSTDFRKEAQMSSFIKICSVEAELFHADRWS